MYKDEFFKGLREGLESGLSKKASESGYIDAVIEEMQKEAGIMDFLRGAGNTLGSEDGGNAFGNHVAQSAGKMLPPLAVGLGLAAAAKAIGAVGDMRARSRFQEALRIAIERNPVLKEADQDRLQRYGDSIFRIAPITSEDPNILGTVLVNAVRYEQLDPNTLKMLGEMEAKRTSGRDFAPKSLTIA